MFSRQLDVLISNYLIWATIISTDCGSGQNDDKNRYFFIAYVIILSVHLWLTQTIIIRAPMM